MRKGTNFPELEYTSLKTEIIERMKLVRQTETFCLTGIGIIWGWAFTALKTERIEYIPFIWVSVANALIIVSLAWVTVFDREGIYKIGRYIKANYESKISNKPGWENFKSDDIKQESNAKRFHVLRILFTSRHAIYFMFIMFINSLIGISATFSSLIIPCQGCNIVKISQIFLEEAEGISVCDSFGIIILFQLWIVFIYALWRIANAFKYLNT